MSEEKKRGGYRANAKRPKKTEDEKLIKRQVFFRKDQLEKLEGKNLSVEIRKLIDFSYDFSKSEIDTPQYSTKERGKYHRWFDEVGGKYCMWCKTKKRNGLFFDKNNNQIDVPPKCFHDKSF